MIARETWHDLEHQTAVLRRGDRLLVLSAARLPVLLPSFDSVRAAVAMGRPSDLTVEVVAAQIDRTGAARASADLEDAEWIASVEITGEDWVGRARHGARPPELDEGGFGLSTPVLLDERIAQQEGVPLLDAMLPSTTLAGRRRIGMHVEVYGVAANERLRFRLIADAVRLDRSLLGTVATALRLRSRSSSLEVRWEEPAELQESGVAPRYLTVELGDLEDGDYELVVQVERENGAVASAARRFRLGRGGQ